MIMKLHFLLVMRHAISVMVCMFLELALLHDRYVIEVCSCHAKVNHSRSVCIKTCTLDKRAKFHAYCNTHEFIVS